MRLTGLSQSQVSKFLAGQRRRLTRDVRAIFQYADIDIESESSTVTLSLSQSVRQAMEENPRVVALVARLIEAMVPVLSSLPEPAPATKEGA